MLAKLISILLFLSIVCFNTISSQLMCWKCDPCPEPHSNTSSLVTAATCTSSQTICVKNSVRVLNRAPQISKGCVESCTPSASNFFGQGAFVDCCNTDYCNFSTRNQLSSNIYLFVIPIFLYIFHHHQKNNDC